jgi:phage terminase small subunit
MAGQGGARAGGGKKKLPTQLKIVKGTYQPCRDDVNAPEPDKRKPVAPSHLNERARFHFDRFVELMGDRASVSFVDVLTLAAITAEDVERFYQVIYETPFFKTVDSFGNDVLKSHPATVQYKEAKRHHHTLLSELGLVPSKMADSGGKKKVDDWDDF